MRLAVAVGERDREHGPVVGPEGGGRSGRRGRRGSEEQPDGGRDEIDHERKIGRRAPSCPARRLGGAETAAAKPTAHHGFAAQPPLMNNKGARCALLSDPATSSGAGAEPSRSAGKAPCTSRDGRQYAPRWRSSPRRAFPRRAASASARWRPACTGWTFPGWPLSRTPRWPPRRRTSSPGTASAPRCRAPSPASVRTEGEIGVILLRSMGGSGVGRHVLGATRNRDTRNPTVWVYFDEVASTLGLAGRPTESWSAGGAGRARPRPRPGGGPRDRARPPPRASARPRGPDVRALRTARADGGRAGHALGPARRPAPGGPGTVTAETLMDGGNAMKGGALPAKALLLSPSCDFHGPPAVYGPSFDRGGRPSARTAGPPRETRPCRRSF